MFTTSSDKAEYALNLGAHEAIINPTPKDKVQRKLDIIINTVPYDLNWNYYLEHLGSDGTLTFVGVPPKPLSLPIGLLLQKRKRVMASPIGGRAIMNEMLRIAAEHEVHAQTEIFSTKEANLAIQKVRENTIRYRAVLDFRK